MASRGLAVMSVGLMAGMAGMAGVANQAGGTPRRGRILIVRWILTAWQARYLMPADLLLLLLLLLL